MKKIYIITGIFLFVIAGYLYLRFGILKTKRFTPDSSKATSALDLGPSIIAKLQQLIQDGSNGLYNLSIDKLEPNLSLSTLYVENATLSADSAILAKLEKAHTAPDNVFKISFKSLHINGIDIPGLLSNKIDLETIHLINPVIDVYHTKREYNKAAIEKNDSLTLYMRLMKSMKKINLDTLLIENGSFINHNIGKKNSITRIGHIAIKMADILIDSSTQYDNNRFLFAKSADISIKDYVLPTPDSLYYFKVSSIELSAVKHTLIALNADLVPRGNKEQFGKKLGHISDMFTIKTQKITLNNVNWYDILNEEKFILSEGTIEGCDFNDYFDLSLPHTTSIPSLDNFPQQLLMQMSLPVYIQKINLKHVNVKYEEFHPSVQQSGTIYFNNINGQLTNITNIPEYIHSNSKMKLSATALFMNKVNFEADFLLDLKNHKTGDFSVDATMGEIDSTLINPFSRPMGRIAIKKGMVNKVVAHVEGNDYKGTGELLLLYDDLAIDPLKIGNDDKLKRNKLTGFLANLILVKKANPFKGEKPRTATCDFKRDPHGSFFNLIWKTILTGVLKTTGLPVKLAYQ